MYPNRKHKWIDATLAVMLTASLAGNWFQWRSLEGWLRVQSNSAVVSAGSEARMVMTTRRLLDEGDLEGVDKHLGFMLQGHTDFLRIVAENDDGPERRRDQAAELLAKIEDGTLLDHPGSSRSADASPKR